ncbi:RNA-dependent ATPase DBP3 [Sporobolomyces koalae]|uniref:RNA-dependent ATPase DBP3 n=1 Tax=Sporobolomyces koalae TaxID=500713 RepID=UPI003178B39C
MSEDTKALSPEQIAKAERKAAKKAKKQAEKQQQESTPTTPAETAAPEAKVEETEEERKKREKKEKKAAKKDKKRSREDEATATETAPAAAAAQADEPSKKKSKKDKAPAVEQPAAPVASTSSTATTTGTAASADECAAFLKENNITHTPESAATEYPPVLSFASLPLNAGVRKGLSAYSKPTPIQSAAFPVMLGGRDMIGVAETGSGKTVAFGVPAIEHILTLPQSKKGKSTAPVSVLIICPTRELAMQTHNNLEMICSALSPPLASVCLYGGVSKPDQIRTLRNERPRIVVGTPGRLLDLARENSLDLSKVSWLVLDEADRMLDKGFENDIREIIKLCMPTPTSPLRPITEQAGEEPKFRRTAMFSATWPMSVRQLAADFMTSPLRITVGSDSLQANSRVEQTAIVVNDGRQKESLLLTHLRDNGFSQNKARSDAGGKDREKALIFALYKKEATRLFDMLKAKGFQVGCINGDMSQEKRTQSLADFKEGRVGLLVATDVAARGLDIPKVELVINVTFPLTIEDYIHRIGRTGRAGRTGKSITFFTEADKALAGQYIRLLRDSNAVVPPGLDQWGTTIKKAVHSSYGAHFKEPVSGTAKKITFD